MATAKKSQSSGSGKRRVATEVLAAAAVFLSKPENRAKLAAAGKVVTDGIHAATGRLKREQDGQAETTRRRAVNPFGLARMSERVTSSRASLVRVRAVLGESATPALAPLDSLIAQIDVALVAAKGLPAGKRLAALRKIDHLLDEVERTLMNAVIPTD